MQTGTGMVTDHNISVICRGNKVLEREIRNNLSQYQPYLSKRGLNNSVLPAYRKCIQVARNNQIDEKVLKYIDAIKLGLDSSKQYEQLFFENYNKNYDNFMREYILEHATPPDDLKNYILEINGGNVGILLSTI